MTDIRDDERTMVDLHHGVTAHVATSPDGTGPVLVALEHHCHLDDGSKVTTVVDWAAFTESHQATFDHEGRLTVRPVVACDCCGLYGEITDDSFEPLEADQ